MRPVLAAALALTALAGCGPSDTELRNQVRESLLSSCLQADRGRAPVSDADWRRLCGCVTDRLTEAKSGKELAERPPEEAERRDAVRLCAAEIAPVQRAAR